MGVDTSAEMLARAPQPHHLADATALPFSDERFGSVVLLYVLYHLPDPARALAEARRVLGHRGARRASRRRAGTIRPSSPMRFPRRALTFDAELAPELLAEHFADGRGRALERPAGCKLPTQAAVLATT